MMIKSIEEKKSFLNFIKNKNIVIPYNQREYVWNKENIEGFFNVILDYIDENSKFYPNDIFVTEENDKLLIIDGQQRITTLILSLIYFYKNYSFILKLLETKLNKTKFNRIKKDSENFIYEKNYEIYENFENNNFQFLNNEEIKIIFENVLYIQSNNTMKEYKKFLLNIDNNELKNNIYYTNFNIIIKYIENLSETQKIVFFENILHNLTFIFKFTTIEKINDLFLLLNSTGKKLTKMEYFKNKIMLNVYSKTELNELEEYLNSIDESLLEYYKLNFKGNRKSRENKTKSEVIEELFIKTFSIHIAFNNNIINPKIDIKEKKFIQQLDKIFKNNDFSIRKTFLIDYLKTLSILLKINEKWNNKDSIKNIYYIFMSSKNNLSLFSLYYPVFYFIENEKERLDFIKYINLYISQKLLLENDVITRTFNIFNNDHYCNIWLENDFNQLKNKFKNYFYKLIEKNILSNNLFINKKLDTTNSRTLLIFSILNNKSLLKQLGDYNFENKVINNEITLEHILPQSILDKDNSDNEYLTNININEILINSFNNFTLLTGKSNSKFNNKQPNEKYKITEIEIMNLIKILKPELFNNIKNSVIYKEEFINDILNLNKNIIFSYSDIKVLFDKELLKNFFYKKDEIC